MDLQQITINGSKIIALPVYLEALVKAHEELVSLGIGHGNLKGFVLAGETTGSWRSLVLQKQLVAKGASKTLFSNHRRGTAVDCAADWDYIGKIAPTMKKYGLVNDLAYIKGSQTSSQKLPGYTAWDGRHFNLKSNTEAMKYPIIDVAPTILKQFSMQDYNEHLIQLTEVGVTDSGSFALVIGGKKRLVIKSRLTEALATYIMRDMKKAAVNKATWDGIPNGENF